MSRNFGTGPCVLAGLKNASGDAVVYMDSDLQDPPELIPDLIKKFEEGADVVHTKRTKRLGESNGTESDWKRNHRYWAVGKLGKLGGSRS